MCEKINNNTPMEDMTIGGTIYEAGNAKNFKNYAYIKTFRIKG